MRKCILALIALFGLVIAAQAAFWQGQTYLPPIDPRIQKNLVTDYGATCDGVADDTSAFLAFKAAFQGSTPVQLNLPGNCTFLPVGGGSNPNFFTFSGIADLIVQGNGTATSGIKSLSGGLVLGARGQYQDNNHSVRTLDANAGDSCVTLKTTAAFNVTGAANNLPVPATFTASVSGTTMTVTAVASGVIAPGAFLTNANSNMTSFTAVQPYGTDGTTGVGGVGTYAVTISQTRSSQTTTSAPASFNASVDTAGVVTVNSIADGAIAPGMFLYTANGQLNKSSVKSQLTGTPGGVGTYQLDLAPGSAVTSRDVIGNGQIRLTVNSTAGMVSGVTGDTIYLPDITNATGQLRQRSNGLLWIKVIDSTHIDIFQNDFNGGYISGTFVGGGDRTSLFPIGSKVLMTGWNNQSYWNSPYGFPSNPHWFEYKTVVSTNSTTHEVCFDTPLADTYKAEWPQFNTGSPFEIDPAGPATLYVLYPEWEMTAVFKDLTIDASGQTYIRGRNVTLNNVAMTGSNCVAPTENQTVNWISVSGTSCQIETDKIVKNWNISTGSFRKVDIQSSSFHNVTVDNVTTTNGWNGSGRRMVMANSTHTAGLKFGIFAYGSSEESTCTSCDVTSFGETGPISRVDNPRFPWSMSGGVITIPNAYTNLDSTVEMQTRGMPPGTYVQWRGGGGGGTVAQNGRFFKVITATQDVDNTYVQTSEVGGFPTGAWTTNGLSVAPHPAPMMTVNFVGTSDISALVLNGCPAQAPMYSCGNVTYTGGATGGSTPGYGPILWGVLDTFTFTNDVPYTNTGALGWTMTRFGNTQVLNTDNTTTTFGSTNMINTKLPSSAGGGTRTLTQSGATGTQSLDNLSAPPTDAWFGGQYGPIFTANTPSDSPQVTVTYRTNQQLPP